MTACGQPQIVWLPISRSDLGRRYNYVKHVTNYGAPWPTMDIDREKVEEAVRILQSLTPTSRSSLEESPCSSGVQSSSTQPSKLLSDEGI